MLARLPRTVLTSGRATSLFTRPGHPASARFSTGRRHTQFRRQKLIAYCALPAAILTVFLLDDDTSESEKTTLDTFAPQTLLLLSGFSWPLGGKKDTITTAANTSSATSRTPNPNANMPIPPGRPETLTPEQEVKLKELWSATLHVFGVGPTADSVSAVPSTETTPESGVSTPTQSDVSTPAQSDAASTSSGKDKKKSGGLRGLLGRKKDGKDKSEASSASGSPATSAPATTTEAVTSGADAVSAALNESSDDKHGQNKAFKTALADLSPEELRTAFWDMVKHDNPDGLLLRFLRARKWDVEKALVMMISTMQWRLKEMNVEGLNKKGELAAFEDPKGDDFYQQVKLGKSYLHGVDKEGRPICYIRVKLHKAGEQSEESLERYTVYIMETARLMLQPPVDTATVVFDMNGFSLANMDYAPVKYLIKCFEAHYPESLGVCCVHKAPWVFQGIWSIIKGWLDPVVASKIHFTRSIEDLAEFIDKQHIPKEHGGDEDWEYKPSDPVPGENDAQKDTETLAKLRTERRKIVESYEALTKAWILEKSAPTDGTATPTQNGSATAQTNPTETLKKRNDLAHKLKEDYWRADKYLRAKTIYDRMGVIKPNGDIDVYAYKSKPPAPADLPPAPAPAASAKVEPAKDDAAPPKKAEEWDVD